MSEGKKVLNLDAELERVEITYQGDTYQLRNRSELSVLEAHRFSALLKEYDQLTDEDLSDETAQKIGGALSSIAAVLVVDPPKDGFPEQLCAAILSFWTEQHSPPPQRRRPQDRRPPKKKASTGAR